MKTPFKTDDLFIVEPTKPVKQVIIWLHGLGASAYDFESIIPYLQQMPSFQAVRFIFPQAPMRPITLNQGYVMPAWYDILQLDKHGPQDKQGVEQSSVFLQSLIEQQIEQGIASEDIYLIGFSQGAAMVLYTSLMFSQTLGGVVDLSGYLPLLEDIKQQMHDKPQTINTSNRYWAAHGVNDMVVPLQYNLESVEFLKTMTPQVEWHTYDMGHEIIPSEITQMASWLSHSMQHNCKG